MTSSVVRRCEEGEPRVAPGSVLNLRRPDDVGGRILHGTAVVGTHLMTALLALGAPDGLRIDWVRTGTVAEQRCPPGAVIAQQIRRRLREAPQARVEGTIRADGPGWVASLVVDRAGLPAARRTFQAADGDCGPVSDAAALAAAILLDPLAQLTPLAPDEARPDPNPRAGEAPSASEVPRQPRGVALTVGAIAHGGSLPGFGVGPRVEGRWRFAGPWSLDVGMEWLPEQTTGPFAFSLTAGYAGIGVERSVGRFRLGVGFHGHLGALSAIVLRSDEVTASAPGSYVWGGVSLKGRAGIGLGGGWGVEAFAAPLLAVTRRAFVVAGRPEPIFEEDRVALRVGVALVFDFNG